MHIQTRLSLLLGAAALMSLTLGGCSGSQSPLGGIQQTVAQHDRSALRPMSTGSDPCAAPDEQGVGQCHAAAMQAVITYFAQIKKATGLSSPPPEDQAGQLFLETALQLPQIDDPTKTLFNDALADYAAIQGAHISSDCQSALAKFNSGFDAIGAAPSAAKVLKYLKKQQNRYPSCDGFSSGVQSAVYLVTDGESTIYNPKWYKKMGDGPGSTGPIEPQLRGILKSDVAGAIGGAVAGAVVAGVGAGPGALGGAIAGSVGKAVENLWDWAMSG